MIRLNRHSFLFFSLALFLGLLLSGIFQKILPLLLQHTVYYCQQAFQAFSIRIPSSFSLFIYFVVGIVLLMVIAKVYFHFVTVQKLRKQFDMHVSEAKNKTIYDVVKKLHLEKKTVVFSDKKPLAFCLGIRNPKIYISTGIIAIMNEKELEAILLHEKYHLENRDTFTMLLASVIQFMFPFFPIITDLLTNYRIEREINADKEAIEFLGDNSPLISVLKKMLAMPQPAIIGISAVAEYDSLEPRIRILTQKNFSRRKFKALNILISLCSVIILSTILLTPVQAIEMQSMHEKTTMVCMSGDSCAKWCKEHNTVVPFSQSKPQTNASHPYSSAQ